MDCPRTGTSLKTAKVGGIPVYISEACGGVFFENQALKNFELPNDRKGEVLVEHLKQFHNQTLNEAERVTCPNCPDTVMMRRFYSPLHVVEIDECPNCGGIWLDTGELEKLRALFLDEKERALLRAKLLEESRPVEINTPVTMTPKMYHREDKVNKLFDIARYLGQFW